MMDGLAFLPRADLDLADFGLGAQYVVGTRMQRTVRTPISCVGTGLHGGAAVSVRLLPARPGHGIAFSRTDVGVTIPARFDAVTDTRLCTVVGAGPNRVGTVEHLMAALSAAGIDNLVIEVDGPELPILDGSAEPWLFLLDCAGREDQDTAAAFTEVLRTVRVEEGDAFAELRPRPRDLVDPIGLDLAMSIDFDAAAIGVQALAFALDGAGFRRELARARTFTLRHEIDGLRRAGLARGGSLDNAIVVDGDTVLNPGGLRMADEFVRHKLLDAVGDLALAGAPLAGRFTGHKSGHALNNRLLRALFADAANYRVVTPVRPETRLAA